MPAADAIMNALMKADSKPSRDARLAAEACRRIDAALARGEAAPPLAALAKAANLSPHHFHRLFRAATGVTPKAWADAQRARLARERLGQPGVRITDAMLDAGYNASSRFYAQANARLGMPPRAFRGGGAGQDIRFAVGQCTLGALLVARSTRGICAISLGDDPDALVRELQDRFPQARFIGGDPGFEQWVAQVVGLVEAPGIGLDLPLDVRGTAFQERVWQALRKIPPGSTATYAQIAEAIGQPGAARAVARACATNTLAVAIPCHRVTRSDGALSGYRWGVPRKHELLRREGAR